MLQKHYENAILQQLVQRLAKQEHDTNKIQLDLDDLKFLTFTNFVSFECAVYQ
jgi:hypothetical protein